MSKSFTYKVIFVNVPPTYFVKETDPSLLLTDNQSEQKLIESSIVESKVNAINLAHPTWQAVSGNPTSPPPHWP